MLNEPAGNCSSTSADSHCTYFAVSATTAAREGSRSNGEAKPIQGTNELISRQQAVGAGTVELLLLLQVELKPGGDITCMIDCAVVQRSAPKENESASLCELVMGNDKKKSKSKMGSGEWGSMQHTGATIDCHKLVAHDVRLAALLAARLHL